MMHCTPPLEMTCVCLLRCDCFPSSYVERRSGCDFIEQPCQRQNGQQQLPVNLADYEHVFVFI